MFIIAIILAPLFLGWQVKYAIFRFRDEQESADIKHHRDESAQHNPEKAEKAQRRYIDPLSSDNGKAAKDSEKKGSQSEI